MKTKKLFTPSLVKGVLLCVLAGCLVTGSLFGFHSAVAQNSSPTQPVNSETEQKNNSSSPSLVKLTFPAIIYSDIAKEHSHVQDAAHIQVAKVYPTSPQRMAAKAKNKEHSQSVQAQMAESRRTKGSFVTETITNIKFVILGAVLLMLGGLFISSLLPQFSEAEAMADAQERLAGRLKPSEPKIYETEFGEMIDLSASSYADSSSRSKLFAFEEESVIEDEYPLEDITDESSALGEPEEHLTPVSLSSVVRPSPALMRTAKSFFTQNRFECVSSSDDRATLRSELSPYSGYGEIPLFLIQGVSVCEVMVQELYTSILQRGHNSSKKLAFAVVDELPQPSAYQQISEYAAEKNFQIVLMNSQHLLKAVRTSQCPQALEKIMSSLVLRDEYESMTPVENPLEFFGREELLDSLLHSVSHLQHIGLFGLRSIGKTSLIWQLREQLSQHIVVYIDLQQVPRNCNYLYREIVKECYRDASFKYPELTLPDLHDLDAEKQENQSIRFIQSLTALWEALKTHRHDVKILLLLDEAEHFAPKPDEQESGFSGFHEFMGIIRGISQQYGFLVSVVVSSSPEISRIDTWKGQSNPGFQFYKEVFLTSLPENGCNHMIESLGAQMGLSYTEEALSRIYYETGGHPYVTRQLCSLIAEQVVTSEDRGQRYNIESQDVENAISEYIELKSDYLSSVWQRLSSIEQDILLTITTNHSCALKDLISPGEDYDARRLRRKAISTLIENELIEKCENKYSMKMGLFERFLLPSN